MKKVLLTGVSGFLGSHTAIQLLEKGYEVTGTLRDLSRAESIKEIIGSRTAKVENLKFEQAELNNIEVWQRLTKGVDFVQHIASPFPRILPKDENDLILPAKNGVLNILHASAANGVKRVVLTSSSSAILYGKPKDKRSGTFDETVWTDVANKADTTPYFRSKTIAEKAAWDFIKKDASGLELATVLPGAILGPVLEDDFGTSANIVLKALDGTMPAIPSIGFDMVDVRSVAELLILAMEKPEAANQRYAGAAGFMKFKDVIDVLRDAYPKRKFPKMVLPDFAVRLFSNFDKTLKPILIDLNTERKLNSMKAQTQLGWKPVPVENAILACAESLFEVGLIKR